MNDWYLFSHFDDSICAKLMTEFLPQRISDHLGVLKALLQGALHRRSDRPGNPFKIFCNSQKWYSFAIPCWHYYDLTSQKIAFRAWRNVHNTETFGFQDKPYDVFLSYSHEDEAWVEQVYCARVDVSSVLVMDKILRNLNIAKFSEYLHNFDRGLFPSTRIGPCGRLGHQF